MTQFQRKAYIEETLEYQLALVPRRFGEFLTDFLSKILIFFPHQKHWSTKFFSKMPSIWLLTDFH